MSGADDQRLAPTETQRLRNQIDDLTRERDLYKRMLERYEPDPTYSTPTELDRLRAELAETRDRRDYLQGQLDIIYDAEYSRNDALKRRIEKLTTAGDALFAAADRATPTAWVTKAEEVLTDLLAALDQWRSVRGDAPTQPPAADLSWPVDGPDPINTLRNLPGAHPHIDIVEARLHALLPPALEAGCPDCGSDDCDDYDWATRARHEAAVLAVFEEYGYREGASLARLAVIAIEGVSVPQKPTESPDGDR